MTPILHFIFGGGMTEQGWQDLKKAVDPFYKQRIPFPVDIRYYHFDTDDVYAMIKASQPTGPVMLIGHSFGACRGVDVCKQFDAVGREVHFIMHDPVQIGAHDVPNTKGFALSKNVVEAICFTRKAQGMPFSGKIVSGPNFKNVQYEGDHGWSVWRAENIAMAAAVLKGGYFLPKPAPSPTPTSSPSPDAAKRIAELEAEVARLNAALKEIQAVVAQFNAK